MNCEYKLLMLNRSDYVMVVWDWRKERKNIVAE